MRAKLMRLLLAIGVLFGLALATAFSTLIFGRVDGREFAPDTFEHRSYTYYELPIVRLKVTPVWRTTSRSDLEQSLVDRKYVVPTTPPSRWDLVRAYRRGRMWREGDARILQDYLDAAGESSPHWLEWSNREPKLAAVLWPEVANVARADLYILVPDLFELAAVSKDSVQLKADLAARLARRYEELAQLELELGHARTAERFFTTALNYEPDRASSVAGRDRARELGSSEPPATPDAAPPTADVTAEKDPGP